MHLRGLLILTASAAFALVPGAGTAPAQAVQLFGTVGPGFTITLAHADGRLVSQLDPGTYEIVVRDLSDEHNFRLFGPGVEEFTPVETLASVTWTVTFREGRYTVWCDPHSTQMVRLFTVGNPPPVQPPKTPPATATPKLLATVGPGNSISLRSGSGAMLHNGVKSGTYAVVVRDRSKRHNFHLVGKGINRRSTISGTGTSTWKLKLAKGLLRFLSDTAPKTVKGSVRVL